MRKIKWFGVTYLNDGVHAGGYILCLFGHVYTVARISCRFRNLLELNGPRVSH